MANKAAPITAPTGLKRMLAAAHCGVSPAHFEKMIAEGLLPSPRKLGGVKLWLRQELDDAMFALEAEGGEIGENTCDRLFG